MRCSLPIRRSLANLSSRRKFANFSEALSNTCPCSPSTLLMASIKPGGGGREAAMEDKCGNNSTYFSMLRARPRAATRVLLISISSSGASTPDRSARSIWGRISCAPPMLIWACSLSKRRASVVRASLSWASSRSLVGRIARAKVADALKSAYFSRRWSTLGNSNTEKVFSSMAG